MFVVELNPKVRLNHNGKPPRAILRVRQRLSKSRARVDAVNVQHTWFHQSIKLTFHSQNQQFKPQKQ
jgi:hypothetical protein